MPKATIAIEDRRFYQHGGVDYEGIARAAWKDLSAGKVVEGGSTITQQLVRQLYIGRERTFRRKVKEACLAIKLSRRWSKPRILDEYLNTVYYGNHAYGVEAAAQTYYSKHARDLTLLQRGDGEGHRKVRLARAGRADPERDRALANGVDVALLRHRLRRDLLAAVAPDDVPEELLHVLGLVDRIQHGVDGRRPDRLARFDELDELVQHGARLRDVEVLTLDRDPVAAQVDRALEPVPQRLQHAVADPAELRGDVVRNIENLLHPAQCRRGLPDATPASP